MRQNNIIKTTAYLFGCRYDDPEFDSGDSYEHYDAAQKLIDEYGWKEVFPYWFDYLQRCCQTEQDVINFANLFYYYGGTDLPVCDPYPFISYFYYRVDIGKFRGEATDIFDSIAIPLLSNIGDVSLETSPDYVPEKDPRIIAAKDVWTQKEKACSSRTQNHSR